MISLNVSKISRQNAAAQNIDIQQVIYKPSATVAQQELK